MTIPWVRSMWWRSDDADIVIPYSLHIILVFFCSLNVDPSHVDLHLYGNTPCCPQINTGVHTIDLVLPRFVYSHTLSKVLTTTARVVFTHGFAASYAGVFCIEHYVVIYRHQYQPMLIFLRPTDFQKHFPYHYVQKNVEYCWEDWDPLGQSSLYSKRPTIEPSRLRDHHLLIPKHL